LIDPILIATMPPKIMHFLTRASAFKNPIANFLLRSIKMLPIYRIRDGLDSISKNQEIFETCFEIFNQNESILIFPEGNHGFPRRVRILSKGFTRIAFGFLDKYPEKELWIVPIGLNYSDILKPFEKVTIIYGKPILVNAYYNPNELNASIDNLKAKVFTDFTELTTHIESVDLHDKIVNKLKSEGNDFMDPTATNKRVKELEKSDFDITAKAKKPKTILQKIVFGLFNVNTIFPILIWQKVKKSVKDIVMLSTYRFGFSLGLIPLFYLLQAFIVTAIFGKWIGLFYLIFSFALVYIRKYLY
jgi:hypothetical protein